MTSAGTLFTNGASLGDEMPLFGAEDPLLDGDDAFRQINFERVYHDGPTNSTNKKQIHEMRRSEVLVPDQIPLSMCTSIICRTVIERDCLQYRLENIGNEKPKLVVVRGMFECHGIFLDHVSFEGGKLLFAFHPPNNSPQESYEVCIRYGGQEHVEELRATPPSADWVWAWKTGLDPHETHHFEIWIEKQLAFDGPIGPKPTEIVF